MTYRVLIVDDEAPAREKIIQFLDSLPPAFRTEMACNSSEALQQLKRESYDLMFLDIQMPRMNAFEMLNELASERWPPIIFSTAYNQYAVRAFEVHAADYLLKPYDLDRFRVAVERVLNRIGEPESPKQVIRQLLQNWRPDTDLPDTLWINQGSKILPVAVADMEYLESDGNYVIVYTPGHRHIVKQSLREFHSKLDQRQFIRVHRSFVVNRKKIREMHPKSHGDLFAILQSGAKIPVSRRYKEALLIN